FACEVRDIFTPRRDSQAAHTGNLQDGGVQQQTLGLARNTMVAQLDALSIKQIELQSGGDGFLAYLQRLKLLMQRLQSFQLALINVERGRPFLISFERS